MSVRVHRRSARSGVQERGMKAAGVGRTIAQTAIAKGVRGKCHAILLTEVMWRGICSGLLAYRNEW